LWTMHRSRDLRHRRQAESMRLPSEDVYRSRDRMRLGPRWLWRNGAMRRVPGGHRLWRRRTQPLWHHGLRPQKMRRFPHCVRHALGWMRRYYRVLELHRTTNVWRWRSPEPMRLHIRYLRGSRQRLRHDRRWVRRNNRLSDVMPGAQDLRRRRAAQRVRLHADHRMSRERLRRPTRRLRRRARMRKLPAPHAMWWRRRAQSMWQVMGKQ
jgi:hypothetical protein